MISAPQHPFPLLLAALQVASVAGKGGRGGGYSGGGKSQGGGWGNDGGSCSGGCIIAICGIVLLILLGGAYQWYRIHRIKQEQEQEQEQEQAEETADAPLPPRLMVKAISTFEPAAGMADQLSLALGEEVSNAYEQMAM